MIRIRRGDVNTGLTLLLSELDRVGEARFLPRFLFPLGELAVCFGEANELDKGLAAVDETLKRCKTRHEEWYVPELLRIKGELTLKSSQDQCESMAEPCFSEALNLARRQGALFWELRTSLSFARLRVRQDRRTEARQILAPMYGAFANDLARIADAREAKALLDGLAAE